MEIEIKAKVKNFISIKRRLRALGARFVSRQHQIDYYYAPAGRPLRYVDKGHALRVRHVVNTNTTYFEFHTGLDPFTAEEIFVEVNSWSEIQRILKGLRAKRELIVEKRRAYYKKGIYEIALDQVEGLGNYIEVEMNGRQSSLNKQRVTNFCRRLGIQEKDFIVDARYTHMMAHKKGKKYVFF